MKDMKNLCVIRHGSIEQMLAELDSGGPATERELREALKNALDKLREKQEAEEAQRLTAPKDTDLRDRVAALELAVAQLKAQLPCNTLI